MSESNAMAVFIGEVETIDKGSHPAHFWLRLRVKTKFQTWIYKIWSSDFNAANILKKAQKGDMLKIWAEINMQKIEAIFGDQGDKSPEEIERLKNIFRTPAFFLLKLEKIEKPISN